MIDTALKLIMYIKVKEKKMFDDRRILAIIPARGGSKGIPYKNIIDLNGKPLISYSIMAALNSEYIDYVLVSTDDLKIAKRAEEYGAKVPFIRPAEYAQDKSNIIDVITHAIIYLKECREVFDTMILLQPTQPLRTTADIDKAIETFFENAEESLVSICEVDDSPLLMRTLNKGKMTKLLNVSSTCRRQDMPSYYRVNGCIYINNIDSLNFDTSLNDNTLPFIMKKSHSVDIDDMIDLEVAKYYLSEKQLEM